MYGYSCELVWVHRLIVEKMDETNKLLSQLQIGFVISLAIIQLVASWGSFKSLVWFSHRTTSTYLSFGRKLEKPIR